MKKSSELGCFLASDFLADTYLSGTNTEKDIEKAKLYNEQAKLMGSPYESERSIRIIIVSTQKVYTKMTSVMFDKKYIQV